MESATDRFRINDFARRSFRDMADGDYILARLAHRNRLIPRFIWNSQQAIEKYLKAILLFHRSACKDKKHDLRPLTNRASGDDPELGLDAVVNGHQRCSPGGRKSDRAATTPGHWKVGEFSVKTRKAVRSGFLLGQTAVIGCYAAPGTAAIPVHLIRQVYRDGERFRIGFVRSEAGTFRKLCATVLLSSLKQTIQFTLNGSQLRVGSGKTPLLGQLC